jgi:hypothetical protein
MPHDITVLSVRGPLTAELLRIRDIPCPDIYCDPLWLLPKYVPRPVQRQYSYIIAPHINDIHMGVLARERGMYVVDVGNAYWQRTLFDILQAESVITSSLHVFVTCHAYNIPVALVRHPGISHMVPDFKFNDYAAAIQLDPRYLTLDSIDAGLEALSQPQPKIVAPDTCAFEDALIEAVHLIENNPYHG